MNKVEFEMKILAAVMLDFSNSSKFLAKFTAEDFDDTRHQWIYKLIDKWHSIGKDTFNLEEIQATYPKIWKFCGDLDYIAEVLDAPMNGTNIDFDSLCSAFDIEVMVSSINKLSTRVTNLLKDNPQDALNELVDGASAIYDRVCIKEDHNLYETFMESINPENSDTIKIGFNKLESIMGPISLGDLVIIAARAGLGKTTFVLAIVINFLALNKNKKVLLFSLEMGTKEILRKLIGNVSNIPVSHLRDANLTKEERECAEYNMRQLSLNHNLVLFEETITNVKAIESYIRKENKKGKVALVVIDYLQLLSGSPNKSAYENISENSRALKLMAKKYNVAIIALSQLNRVTEGKQDKRPSMAEIKGSGSIEADANKILLLYRDDYYDRGNTDVTVPVEVDVAKSREGGNGVVKFTFNKATGRFSEMEEE